MPLRPGSALSRCLRLALAVLGLVASHVSMVRAAVGVTCARTGAVSEAHAARPVDVAGGSNALADVASDAEARHEAPLPAVVAPHCGTAAAVLQPPTDVPTAVTAWGTAAPPLGPEAHLVSHAPVPPFHPPRAS